MRDPALYLQKATVLARVLSLTRPYAKSIAVLFALMASGTSLGLVGPYMSKLLIDVVFKPGSTGNYEHGAMLIVAVGIMFGAQAIGQFATMARARLSARLGNDLLYDLRAVLFGKLQALSLSFHDKQQTGALISRINQDSAELQRFMVDFFPVTLESLLLLAGSAIFLFAFSWKLTLIVAVPLAVCVVVLKRLYNKIGSFFKDFYECRAKLSGRASDSLSGIRVVKVFGEENAELAKFNTLSGQYRDAGIALTRQTSVFSPAFSLIIIGATCAVWFAGGELVLLRKMTLGSIIAYIGYLTMFYRPVMTLGQLLGGIAGPLAAAQRVFEVLDAKVDIVDAPQPIATAEGFGTIELRDVFFTYGEKSVLNGCTCSIKQGSAVAFMGKSGVGKSTIAQLLCRLYDVSSGAVLLDGKDIRSLSIADIRKNIGLVSQETFLFDATIFENIAFAKSGASRVEVKDAAAIASAHQFIIAKPDGYDAVVGERGVALSGGEKQRIAIARALLHGPEILILDEATSAMDLVTENAVLSAIMQSGRVRTLICISHRLALPRRFDEIFVMDQGKIIESGTHDVLLAGSKKYRELINGN